MVADDIIADRLKLLAEYTGELQQLRAMAGTFEGYTGNLVLRRATERSLQVAIEACLDIGRRIISLEGFRYPDDNKDVFAILAEEDVLSQRLLPALVNMARFCNLIVHDYARIDDVQVYTILHSNLLDFDAYARAIVRFLERE